MDRIDLGTGIVLLDKRTKHWRLQCINREGFARRYEVLVWACGKRFAVNRATPLGAVKAALEKIASLGTRGGLKIAEMGEWT